MTFKHISEGLIESGLLQVNPLLAKAEGIAAAARIGGAKPITNLEALWGQCESPIEMAMASALCYAEWPTEVEIEPQHEIGRYRLDFLVSGDGHRIDVECDGENFHHHNITMARYQADRARDAYVKSQGIEVLRYRGSEIWENASGCAEEVSALLNNLMEG